MKAFYSDHFVLPLPPAHTFPMALAIAAAHRPDFVFYVAGADAFAGDRLGRLSLTVDGLRTRDRLVFERFGDLPIAACMAGGYSSDVDSIVLIHANTISELSGSAPALASDGRQERPAARPHALGADPC